MTRLEIIAELRELNPKARDTLLYLWADAFLEYQKLQAVCMASGPVMRDKDKEGKPYGRPYPNPVFALRDKAGERLISIHLATGDLWSPNE
jgi:hypothetical protein